MHSFEFSKRTNWQFGSNPVILSLEKLRENKTPLIDLTESNPTHCGYRYPGKDILNALVDDRNLLYQPLPEGMVDARKVIQKYYQNKGVEVALENIILTSSTSEAYSFLFKLLTDAGDSVLFPEPSYPLFESLVDLHDIQMDRYVLNYDQQWAIDFDSLNDLNSKTKAIVLVNPNNPTGSFIKENDLRELNKICKKENLTIVSDEVFWDFGFEGNSSEKVSLVNNEEVLTFVLGGISKTLALPQMKLAWIIVSGPTDVVRQALNRLEIIADIYLSVSTPIQNALDKWFKVKEDIQIQIRERVRENWSIIQSLSGDMSCCQVLPTEGGWYAVLEIHKPCDEEKLVITLLEKDHVFVHPGYFFDFKREAFLVISLLPTAEVIKEGFKRILRRLDEEYHNS